MPKQRDSVRHAESGQRYETKFERLARDIAFEAGAEIEIRGEDVFIVVDGAEEHLCAIDISKRVWWTVWRAMCQRFPALERYK